MLVDMDLAKELCSGRSGARCRTGTMEFMAVEVLLNIDHTYRHDLESFFYVLLWQCGRRGWEFVRNVKGRPRNSRLTNWYTGSFADIANAKRGNVDAGGFERIMAQEFPPEFDCVKPLCRELRGILFPIRKNAIFAGIPKDPAILYTPIIDAFSKAIDSIKASLAFYFTILFVAISCSMRERFIYLNSALSKTNKYCPLHQSHELIEYIVCRYAINGSPHNW
ncbi:hypothetical protein VTO42DRAFT_6157 [Malbranchea cinnamomea]